MMRVAATLKKIRGAAEHILNPLHVYCRLCDCGVEKRRALRIARRYEGAVYKPLMGPR